MLTSVCMVGRLVADPELRTTPTNVSVTSFSIAVDRSFVRAGEERRRIFLMLSRGGIQPSSFPLLRKALLCPVQGSLSTRKYEDKTETTHPYEISLRMSLLRSIGVRHRPLRRRCADSRSVLFHFNGGVRRLNPKTTSCHLKNRVKGVIPWHLTKK